MRKIEDDLEDMSGKGYVGSRLQIEMIENRKNEEEFVWTTSETNVLVHVAGPNLLGLRLWHCCCCCTTVVGSPGK